MQNTLITSPQNPIVKLVKALHLKKYRNSYGMYFVEGIKIVNEAIQQGVPIEKLIFSEEFCISNLAHPIDKFNSVYVSKNIFKQISGVETPQGVIAIVKKHSMPLLNILQKPSYFLVVLDRVQDPGNVGSIIRTLDAAGGDGVILLEGCADPYNPKTLRSTMGSIFRVPTFEIGEAESFIKQLISMETHLLASCLDGDNLFCWDGDSHKKIALVIGNESRGVREEIIKSASSRVTIPMAGGAESLNASVAAGILIYQIMHKSGKLDRNQ